MADTVQLSQRRDYLYFTYEEIFTTKERLWQATHPRSHNHYELGRDGTQIPF